MYSLEELEHNQELLRVYKTNFRVISLKAAKFGLHTPASVEIELATLKEQIESTILIIDKIQKDLSSEHVRLGEEGYLEELHRLRKNAKGKNRQDSEIKSKRQIGCVITLTIVLIMVLTGSIMSNDMPRPEYTIIAENKIFMIKLFEQPLSIDNKSEIAITNYKGDLILENKNNGSEFIILSGVPSDLIVDPGSYVLTYPMDGLVGEEDIVFLGGRKYEISFFRDFFWSYMAGIGIVSSIIIGILWLNSSNKYY